jgi:hypothetical protein
MPKDISNSLPYENLILQDEILAVRDKDYDVVNHSYHHPSSYQHTQNDNLIPMNHCHY